MPRYLLHHRHQQHECGAVFAGFRGFDSPLRHGSALGSCDFGGHAIWWAVDAASEKHALELLPFFVAERTTVIPVTEVAIP
jgi:hypothetical protein